MVLIDIVHTQICVTSCNSDPAKKLRIFFFLRKEKSPIFKHHLAIVVFRLKRIYLSIIGTNNFLYLQF